MSGTSPGLVWAATWPLSMQGDWRLSAGSSGGYFQTWLPSRALGCFSELGVSVEPGATMNFDIQVTS